MSFPKLSIPKLLFSMMFMDDTLFINLAFILQTLFILVCVEASTLGIKAGNLFFGNNRSVHTRMESHIEHLIV